METSWSSAWARGPRLRSPQSTGTMTRADLQASVGGFGRCLHRWPTTAVRADEMGTRHGLAKDMLHMRAVAFLLTDCEGIEHSTTRMDDT